MFIIWLNLEAEKIIKTWSSSLNYQIPKENVLIVEWPKNITNWHVSPNSESTFPTMQPFTRQMCLLLVPGKKLKKFNKQCFVFLFQQLA